MAAQFTTQYTPVELDQRTLLMENTVRSLLNAGLPDQKIKEVTMQMYGFDSEEYAQNILDYIREFPEPDSRFWS